MKNLGNFRRPHEWHKFSKRFKANVHENEILKADRKLEQSCEESAADIVFEAEDNYDLARGKLNEIYGESYGQIHHCMHKIFN